MVPNTDYSHTILAQESKDTELYERIWRKRFLVHKLLVLLQRWY